MSMTMYDMMMDMPEKEVLSMKTLVLACMRVATLEEQAATLEERKKQDNLIQYYRRENDRLFTQAAQKDEEIKRINALLD